jgi:hypothetical protein
MSSPEQYYFEQQNGTTGQEQPDLLPAEFQWFLIHCTMCFCSWPVLRLCTSALEALNSRRATLAGP